MLIGLAGPVVNFLLALVLMFVYYALFNEVPSVTVKNTVVEWVTPGSAAADAGIQTGDIVRSFGGISNPTWEPQVYEQIKLSPGQYVPVVVDRGGQSLTLSLHVPLAAKGEDFDIGDTGMQPQYLPGPIQVAQVQQGMPAEQAGLRAGDQIAAVDGHAFHSVNTLLAYMQWEQGKPMTLTCCATAPRCRLAATPANTDGSWKLGFTPVPPPMRDEPLPFLAAWEKSFVFFKNNSLVVGEVLERLFTHRLSVSAAYGSGGHRAGGRRSR